MSANAQAAASIKQRRKFMRHEAKDIAKWSGIKLSRYYAIERGEVQITVADLAAIATALETTPFLLLGVFNG